MITILANYIIHTPVILFGGLALTASAITTAIVSEVKSK